MSQSVQKPDKTPQQHNFSCLVCSQRKVKCDRLFNGCSRCAQAGIACVYKAPPPPRRRRLGTRILDTTTRLRAYEDKLRNLGLDPDEVARCHGLMISEQQGTQWNGLKTSETSQMAKTASEVANNGILVSQEGKSRYLDNGLWASLHAELPQSNDLLDDSSEEDLAKELSIEPDVGATLCEADVLFNLPVGAAKLQGLHPSPVHIFKIWQLYLENINPMVKVFHAPTVQQQISYATGDLGHLPKNLEALLFAIYCFTLESLDNNECLNLFGAPKEVARSRFRLGAKHSLVNAGLVKTSDLMTLQAFTIFNLSLYNFNPQSIWIYSGVGFRIAKRIGLHRDGGRLGLPPFESEMRRRLWWQIVMLDGHSQKLAGVGLVASLSQGDTGLPQNLNDGDLFPGMNELPKERETATEMMLYLVRCQIAEFFKRVPIRADAFDGVWGTLASDLIEPGPKERAIDELEALLARKYLVHCDVSIPTHLMCSLLVMGVISMLRFYALGPDRSRTERSAKESDALFGYALAIVSSSNQVYTNPLLHRFRWHLNVHYQWRVFIFLLSEICSFGEGPTVDEAWKQIQITYERHPTLNQIHGRKALITALWRLTLKAWDEYAKTTAGLQAQVPLFIQSICHHLSHEDLSQPLEYKESTENPPQSTPPVTMEHPIEVISPSSFDLAALNNTIPIGTLVETSDAPQIFEPEKMEWAQWDNLLVDFNNGYDDFGLDIADFNLELSL